MGTLSGDTVKGGLHRRQLWGRRTGHFNRGWGPKPERAVDTGSP